MARRSSASIVTETKIVIPECKPAALKIVRVTASPEITNVTLISKKVIVWGYVHVAVEYIFSADDHVEMVTYTSFQCPLSGYITNRKANETLEADLVAKIEFQRYCLETSRAISAYVITKLTVRRLRKKQITCVSNQSEVHAAITNNNQEPPTLVPQIIRRHQPGWNAWNRRFRR